MQYVRIAVGIKNKNSAAFAPQPEIKQKHLSGSFSMYLIVFAAN
jgi:hypothetical protein